MRRRNGCVLGAGACLLLVISCQEPEPAGATSSSRAARLSYEEGFDEAEVAGPNSCPGACGWKCNACTSMVTEYSGNGRCEGPHYVYDRKHYQSCPTKACCQVHDACQRTYCIIGPNFDSGRCVGCQAEALFAGCGPCLDGSCSGTTQAEFDVWWDTATIYNASQCEPPPPPPPPPSNCWDVCYWDYWEACGLCETVCGYSGCSGGSGGCDWGSGNCWEDAGS